MSNTILTIDRMDNEVIFQQINLNTALTIPLQNLVAMTPLPESFESLFDPQRGFGNPLRALFSQNRDFFLLSQICRP